jgi:hypothetical protein
MSFDKWLDTACDCGETLLALWAERKKKDFPQKYAKRVLRKL